MHTIRFEAAFGNKNMQVDLQYLTGGYYHLFIYRYYKGQIINRQGTWYVLPQNTEKFSMDDRDAIADRITDYENKLK